jgi:hypothetical protein
MDFYLQSKVDSLEHSLLTLIGQVRKLESQVEDLRKSEHKECDCKRTETDHGGSIHGFGDRSK